MIEQYSWPALDKFEALRELKSREEGLSQSESEERLKRYGLNQLIVGRHPGLLQISLKTI